MGKINWSDLAGGAISGGFGMLGASANARRQFGYQKQLMNMQHGHQKELNQMGHDLQYDMWNKTNYGAQVEHLKNAGLNVGMMYGGGGAGGTTTGSQGGGSAAGGQAGAFEMQDLQNLLLKKEADKKQSEIDLNNANADNIRGKEGTIGAAEIAKKIAEVGNIGADTAKKIAEASNIKSMEELNEATKLLTNLKVEKKVTGSAIVDTMTALGLDPANNEDDMKKVQMILGAIGITRSLGDIAKLIQSFKKSGKGFTIVNDLNKLID